jgi:hypothetical protein
MIRSQAVGRASCKLEMLCGGSTAMNGMMMMMMDIIQNELLYIITKHIQTIQEINVNACARLYHDYYDKLFIHKNTVPFLYTHNYLHDSILDAVTVMLSA